LIKLDWVVYITEELLWHDLQVSNFKLNCVLKSWDEVNTAVENLKKIGLPQHPHIVKSWDTYRMIDFIKKYGKKDSFILDVGCNGSPILPYLRRQDFQNLYGCDVNLKIRKRRLLRNKILDFLGKKEIGATTELLENKDKFYHLDVQNLEKTNYQDNNFDFVTSLSVIEHGVDITNYFQEMKRILKPRGYLLTSTDYWPNKIETNSNVYHEYKPDVIFSKQEIENILTLAQKTGFELYETLDYEYKDKVVHWEKTGQDYTFILFCLKKIYE